MATPENHSGTSRDLALLSWIQQLAPYGIFTLDAELRVQSWNRWMETHSGLTFGDVADRELEKLFPELNARKLMAPFLRALNGESSMLSTALHRYLLPLWSPSNPDQNDPMLQTARIAPLLSDSEVCGVIVVIEDVTQREHQADILGRRHRRDEVLSLALVQLLKSDEPRKTVRQLFFKIAQHLDFDTFFLYLCEPETAEVKLYTAGGVSDELQARFAEFNELAGMTAEREAVVFNFIGQQPGQELFKKAKILSAVAIPLRVEEKSMGLLCFASGSREQIAAEETELLTTIAQYLATAVDKENTKRELHRIEEANQWMGAIVESSDDAIISIDLAGAIKSCNQGAARLFGYEIAELIGQPVSTLIPEDHHEEEQGILERVRSGGWIENFETLRRRKDGSLLEVSLTISPVKDATGKVIGASKIARDITQRKNSERKLEESFHREKLAREKAEAANRAKDDFLASLSHELRTPLNPILLIASDYSENAELAPEMKAHFETIRKNIELEARLIDDLLDLTRITHGKLSLHPRVVDVKLLLEECLKNIQSEISEKLIHLQFEFRSSRRHVLGDDVRLQQVFWNVLKNAVKFNPQRGNITIVVEAVGEKLQIAITDTGIGMLPGELDQIFGAFSQGGHAKNDPHRFGGLGLGLAISRKLVEMHSGQIFAASEGTGLGSTFTILLPLVESVAPGALPASTPPGKLLKEDLSSVCILLVEDHEPTRTAISHLLTRRGYQIVVAGNSAEARRACESGKIGMVISDIGLPDGSGNDLMVFLSQTYGLKGIALTGYGMEEDIEKCLESGFVTHLIKPVNIRALESALSSVLR